MSDSFFLKEWQEQKSEEGKSNERKSKRVNSQLWVLHSAFHIFMSLFVLPFYKKKNLHNNFLKI